MSARTVLINPHVKGASTFPEGEFFSCTAPNMGLAYLAAAIEQSGRAVRIVDANAYHYDSSQLAGELVRLAPDVVGVTATTTTLMDALEAVRVARAALPDAFVCMGGIHVSRFPAETLSECPELDAVLVGEGEVTICEMLDVLDAGSRDFTQVAGMAFRVADANGEAAPGAAKLSSSWPAGSRRAPAPTRANRSSLRGGMPVNSPLRGSDSTGLPAPPSLLAAREVAEMHCGPAVSGEGGLTGTGAASSDVVVTQPRACIEDLDALPLPARHLLPMELYASGGHPHRMASIVSSRGCPFGCKFCAAPFIAGRRYRARSAKSLLAEVDEIVNVYHMDKFEFVDDLFTLDKERVFEFCRGVKERGWELTWSCSARADTVTPELLRAMAGAGCRVVYLGVESGSQRVLDAIGKRESLEQMADAVRWIHAASMRAWGFFIIGFPDETREEVERTIDFATELELDYAEFFICSAFPGSPLYEYAADQALVRKRTWADISYGRANIENAHMTPWELEYLMVEGYRRFYTNPRIRQRLVYFGEAAMADEVARQTSEEAMRDMRVRARTSVILREFLAERENLVPMLHSVQDEFGYVSPASIEVIAALLGLDGADVRDVASFYKQFRLNPPGRHSVQVCTGTACHVRGGGLVLDEWEKQLGISAGETAADGQWDLQSVACVGCCGIAPVCVVDGEVRGNMKGVDVANVLDEVARADAQERVSGGVSEAVPGASCGSDCGGAESDPSQGGADGGQDVLASPDVAGRDGAHALGASGAAVPPIPEAPIAPAPTRGQLRGLFERVRTAPGLSILVGTATCARSVGALETLACVREQAASHGLACRIVEVGCVGHCYAEPIVAVGNGEDGFVAFGYVDAVAARALVLDLVDGGVRQERCMIGELLGDGTLASEGLAERVTLEQRVVLANCGVIDPLDLGAYEKRGGYRALREALRMAPERLVDMVRASGLRGRGGAGFPTGEKWAACRRVRDDVKYVICNADEGDPGAFVDRMLLESDPHSVVEGMVLAGYAVGASSGIVYVRSEYPLALKRIEAAVSQAFDAGYLGRDVLGSGFAFDIRVFKAAGAFVCGEETALIASLEGLRPRARPRPPYPAESGFHGHPTLVNNAKTLAYVRHIVARGPEWFRSIGAVGNAGTGVFALAGKVARPGLVEVPLGTTLRQVVFGVGGGMQDPNFEIPGREMPHAGIFTRDWTPKKPPLAFKAVQIGGPSGGCLPESLLDTPIDFDSLAAGGAMMGSGGLVVLAHDDCVVDLAEHFVAFTRDASCGRCPSCREGLAQLHERLVRFERGEGSAHDLDELVEAARFVGQGALCGLGKTAPNPVLSAVRHFREEFLAHVERGMCPALTCKALISYRFADVGCTSACDECSVVCDAIKADLSYDGLNARAIRTHEIDDEKCVRCGLCVDSCAGVNHASIVKVTPARHDRRS